MRRSNSHAAGAALVAWLLAAGMVSAPVAAMAAPVKNSEESIASGFSEDVLSVGTDTTEESRDSAGTGARSGPADDEAAYTNGSDILSKTYLPSQSTTDTPPEHNKTNIGISPADGTGAEDNLASSVTQEADLSITHSSAETTEHLPGYSYEYKESQNVALFNSGITYIYHSEEDGATATVAFASPNNASYDDSIVEEVIFNPLTPNAELNTEGSVNSSISQAYSAGSAGGVAADPEGIFVGALDPAGAVQKGSVDEYLTFFEQLDKEESRFYSYIDSFDEHTLMEYSYDSGMPSSERVYIPYELPAEEYVYIPCSKAEFEARTYRTSVAYQNFYVNKVKAYDCWLKDNPKIFWSNGINTITRLKYDEEKGAAVIRQIDFALRQYYKGVLDEVEDVEGALVKAYDAVRRRVGSDTSRVAVFRETEKYINDLMHYNTQAASSSDMNTYGFAHTITGPLLAKYDHSGVCEGYSKLFKIICDELEAPSTIVIGKSYASLQNMDHMWNYVLMNNGEWYLVDCTFDDSSNSNEWFLRGSDSGACRTNHMPIGRFSTGIMYDEVQFPELAYNTYTPSNEDEINWSVWDYVGRLYRIVLEREPDSGGQKSWYAKLVDGSDTGSNVAHGFFFSREFESKMTSDEEYVSILYGAMMNRDADESGIKAWTDLLKQGFSRKKIFEGFTKSREFNTLCGDYGIQAGTYKSREYLDNHAQVTMFVARLYLVCLQREKIDQEGQLSWVRTIVNGESGGSVARKFFMSKEFTNANHSDEAFVTLLYRTIMDREPDTGGMASWVKALGEGISREEVVRGFTGSREFSKLCASYGIAP
jgi:hypothetical protein